MTDQNKTSDENIAEQEAADPGPGTRPPEKDNTREPGPSTGGNQSVARNVTRKGREDPPNPGGAEPREERLDRDDRKKQE